MFNAPQRNPGLTDEANKCVITVILLVNPGCVLTCTVGPVVGPSALLFLLSGHRQFFGNLLHHRWGPAHFVAVTLQVQGHMSFGRFRTDTLSAGRDLRGNFFRVRARYIQGGDKRFGSQRLHTVECTASERLVTGQTLRRKGYIKGCRK